jgi:WD40 repeat protein
MMAAGTGSTFRWRPFSEEKGNLEFHEDFDAGSEISALSLDDLGYDAFGGQKNGVVTCLDMESNKVWKVVTGVNSVSALAANGEKMQVVRGASSGVLDVWDLDTGEEKPAGRQLVGHRDEVRAINVDWTGNRAVTGAKDGYIYIWDLTKASHISQIRAHEDGVGDLVTNFEKGLILSGGADESLRLWSLEGLRKLGDLEGHATAVEFVSADWKNMRALSMSNDRTVKLWDLRTFECTLTFREEVEQVLALRVDWLSMQAMAVLDDGRALIWDLQDPARNPLSEADCDSPLKVATISGKELPRGKSRKDKKPVSEL